MQNIIKYNDLYSRYSEITKDKDKNLFMGKSKFDKSFIIVKLNFHKRVRYSIYVKNNKLNIKSFKNNIKIIKAAMKNVIYSGKSEKETQLKGIKMDKRRIHNALVDINKYKEKYNSFPGEIVFQSTSYKECKKHYNALI